MKKVYIQFSEGGYISDLVEYNPKRSDHKLHEVEGYPQDVLGGYYQISDENVFILDENKRKSIHIMNAVSQELGYMPDMESYDSLVLIKIRERYSISEELAISRQKETKPEEFVDYYDYCEQCKLDAKKELGLL